MLDQLGRPQSWHLPIERARAGSSRNDRKMAARTSARSRVRSMERSASPEAPPPSGHCFHWAESGECPLGSSCKWAHTHTSRDSNDRAGSTPWPRKSKRVKWAKRDRRERGRSGSGNETEGTGGETDGEA